MQIIVEEGVKIVFTSAGYPKIWTFWLKQLGVNVVHVVSSLKFALKVEVSGVVEIVSKGFEAGGHNDRDETTIFTMIQKKHPKLQIPLISAGGIVTGNGMMAFMALGADGI